MSSVKEIFEVAVEIYGRDADKKILYKAEDTLYKENGVGGSLSNLEPVEDCCFSKLKELEDKRKDVHSRERRKDCTLEEDLLPDVDTTDSEIQGKICQIKGFDVLAFYKSYRYRNLTPFPGKWGIFYWNEGLDYLRDSYCKAYPDNNSFFDRSLARRILYQHEIIHFYSDVQTLPLEILTGRPLYSELRFAQSFDSVNFVEETIANIHLLNKMKETLCSKYFRPVNSFIRNFVAHQPGAYSCVNLPLSDLKIQWLKETLNLKSPHAERYSSSLAWWFSNYPKPLNLEAQYVPQYTFDVSRDIWLSAFAHRFTIERIDQDKIIRDLNQDKQLALRWEYTKSQLLKSPNLVSLDFKRWNPEHKKFNTRIWSVRVLKMSGYRAHLEQLNQECTAFRAIAIGPHEKMGHGK